ncbi:hypothetical protein PAAG_02726 [Paracoccidioides lutzii Pb01]|uniref:Centrosomin N-terminal motif 1 domain-containing protein n=1 Tax=Paracoccidioides lutzii (strain ATCC MYA-826 / Pb01) TaxID=502779 RepID=C1GW31_PARBA|nr:hypothetical protein PAAG_02726 [Paracoccidioides lutzii Pb01]EEH40750.1 hypothetical protein PAAG_02726 [Paracoccidioides lutzii Pb01]
MDSHNYRHRLANDGPASSPTVGAAARSRKQFLTESSTRDHSHPSKSNAQRRNMKNSSTRINTDTSRVSASPTSARPDTPQRNNDSTGSTPLVNPTSSLLQGLINEQRASRGGRRAASEHVSESQVQTPTPVPSQADSSSEKQRKVSNVLSAGLKQPREMGMRETDQYVSKLNKLNFDLKLEIYHRSQQLVSLEKKLERMEALEEEVRRLQGVEDQFHELHEVEETNRRLRDSNEHLRMELDKRDQAVNEAVELICQLEAKIETLEPANDANNQLLTARPHTSEGLAVSPAITPKSTLIFDIPDRTSSWKGTSSARSLRSRVETTSSSAHRPRRHPSFLRESSESTSALRSLYITEEDVSRNGFSSASRAGSILSGDELPEPESPRLSILSECSYLNPSATPSKLSIADMASIGPPARSFTQPISKLELSPLGTGEEQNKNSKLSRIDQWIQPQEKNLFISALGPKRPSYTAADNTSSAASSKKQPFLGTAFQAKRPVKAYKFDTPVLDGPIFNGTTLPPTPDTMSTSNADARNGSNSSIIAEKSLLDQGPILANFSSIGHAGLRRPRSADDITTRPSTATTALSGTMETLSNATRLGNNPSRDQLSSMFPAYGHGAGESDPSRLFVHGNLGGGGYEYASRKHKDGNVTTVGDDNGASPKRNRYPVSLKSTHSKPRCADGHDDNEGDEDDNYYGASSPLLTPQDWLEAARPAAHVKCRIHANKRHPLQMDGMDTSQHTLKLSSDDPDDDSDNDENEPQLPTLKNLRVRVCERNNNTPNQNLQQSQPQPPPQPPQNLNLTLRRRLSLRPRFFSRTIAASQQGNTPTSSDAIGDKAGAPFPQIGRRRRMSTGRQTSINVDLSILPLSLGRAASSLGHNGSSNNDTETGASASMASRNVAGRSGTGGRPYTSSSTPEAPSEPTKRRPTSLGLFGWMTGRGGTVTAAAGCTNSTFSHNNTPVRDSPTPTQQMARQAQMPTPTSPAIVSSALKHRRNKSLNQNQKPAKSPGCTVSVTTYPASNGVELYDVASLKDPAIVSVQDNSVMEQRPSRFSHRRALRKV